MPTPKKPAVKKPLARQELRTLARLARTFQGQPLVPALQRPGAAQ